MKISVITLFPQVFKEVLNHSILKRAQEKELLEINIVDHRTFGIGKHKIVDDKAYGGGAGMVFRVDVLSEAINSVRTGFPDEKVLLLCPQGSVYDQKTAEYFSKISHIILVCGHYEGFDERIRELVDYEISIGDFILTGGEIPAMAVIDSVTRLIPGVLKDPSATKYESHSEIDGKRILEGPQYTRPEEYKGMKVPDVYLSGDPKKIESYKKNGALQKTLQKRPDLT